MWSSWSCGVGAKCPNGTQLRERQCTNPMPELGGDLCLTLNSSRSDYEFECGGPGCCASTFEIHIVSILRLKFLSISYFNLKKNGPLLFA